MTSTTHLTCSLVFFNSLVINCVIFSAATTLSNSAFDFSELLPLSREIALFLSPLPRRLAMPMDGGGDELRLGGVEKLIRGEDGAL